MPVKETYQPSANKGSTKGAKYRLVNLCLPKAIDFEFIKESAKGMRPWQYDLTAEASETSPRPISNRAMGVSVAVPDDSSSCAKVLELIRELGVEAVRLDLTYGHDMSRADELIDGLCDMNIGVLLHLVQPLSEAEKMPAAEALSGWVSFVKECLDRFAERIEAVEIGSTINRAKWTRYNLDGFMAAWESASREVRARKLTLIGPNVTDFEPSYNAGILGMLRRRDCLPDIHSNNLFAERAMEPENVDHKIIGDSLKWLHQYDLKKKIRLLGAIAERYGILRSWSTSAFWTIPRIRRYLNSAEEQKADYLARYFTICFSQRYFERVYWGPLISAREGLLDDGSGVFAKSSELDIVALYDHIEGSPASWRKRPSFDTFKTIHSFLGGAQFEGTRCAVNGLEIHEFSKAGEIIHIGWTKNAQLARIRDCYSTEDLEALSDIVSRSGERYTDRPDFLTQSATIFVWDSGHQPVVKRNAGVVPHIVGAPLAKGYQHYDFHTADWQGVVRARSRQEAEILARHLSPDAIAQKEEQGSLRKARNAVWKVTDPRDVNCSLVVKKPRRMAWNKRVIDRNKPSKALRSWNGTTELMHRRIGTPEAVAYFESKDTTDMMSNWFICGHVAEKFTTKQFFAGFSAGEAEVEGFTFEEFSDQLVEFLLRLHGRGFYFRDLSVGNLLVKGYEDKTLEFALIDTARLRCYRTSLSLSYRIADLKRLILKLSPSLQEVFMKKYMKHLKVKFTLRQRLSLKSYAFKTQLKRLKRSLKKSKIFNGHAVIMVESVLSENSTVLALAGLV